ncbi:hypothetical protein ACAG25_11800 [Mycobacterium sp. pV006]|uniref:hypothetical protein n=1 Tax=Mycobacterium sp. pV006 TaxID=3238983 RepID=UPI00351B850A
MPLKQHGVRLQPITSVDLHAVARFLHEELDPAVPVDRWASDIRPTWTVDQPNYGFMLCCRDDVVGVHLAVYSEREIDGVRQRFCNLAAWCVTDAYRAHALRLLRALLRQRAYHFTDLSPSTEVVKLNTRLGFIPLDTTTVAVPNLPWPLRTRGIRVYSSDRKIERVLHGDDLARYRDHRDAVAARQVVIAQGDNVCHVVFRCVPRKNIRRFAALVYVSDPDLFRTAAPHFFQHLLLRYGMVATLIEKHVVDGDFAWSATVSPRAKMFRSATLRPDQIDFLYSELTNMRW